MDKRYIYFYYLNSTNLSSFSDLCNLKELVYSYLFSVVIDSLFYCLQGWISSYFSMFDLIEDICS